MKEKKPHLTPYLADIMKLIQSRFQPFQRFTWIECIAIFDRPEYNLDRLRKIGLLKATTAQDKNGWLQWEYWYEPDGERKNGSRIKRQAKN